MKTPKARANVYPVMRHTFDGNDVVCAVAISPERADELVGEFTQTYLDRGFSPEEVYFYPTTTSFYE